MKISLLIISVSIFIFSIENAHGNPRPRPIRSVTTNQNSKNDIHAGPNSDDKINTFTSGISPPSEEDSSKDFDYDEESQDYKDVDYEMKDLDSEDSESEDLNSESTFWNWWPNYNYRSYYPMGGFRDGGFVRRRTWWPSGMAGGRWGGGRWG